MWALWENICLLSLVTLVWQTLMSLIVTKFPADSLFLKITFIVNKRNFCWVYFCSTFVKLFPFFLKLFYDKPLVLMIAIELSLFNDRMLAHYSQVVHYSMFVRCNQSK